MSLTAADVMTHQVATIGPNSTIAEAAEMMSQRGISAMPVCDKDGHVLGMLSEGDLMRPFGEKFTGRREWWLSLLAEGEKLGPEFQDYVRIDRHSAADLMTTKVISAAEDTPLAHIADLLFEHKIKRVPILRDGKLVGVVSRADIVRAVARDPAALAEDG